MIKPKKIITYYLALDPIHIGDGGGRLGRVDMPVLREAGTNLPKIPGTSIRGMLRHYAARTDYGFPGCTGPTKETPCPKKTCPICKIFGSIDDDSGQSGMLKTFDLRILFYPMETDLGVRWVSCPRELKDAGLTTFLGTATPDAASALAYKADTVKIGPFLITAAQASFTTSELPPLIKEELKQEHLLVVDDDIFSRFVNSGLEVRTSVKINPKTGAADSGALFTYEAIPRGTIFIGSLLWAPPSDQEPEGFLETAAKIVNAAEEYTELLGIGGLSNRGFGRLKLMSDPISFSSGEKHD